MPIAKRMVTIRVRETTVLLGILPKRRRRAPGSGPLPIGLYCGIGGRLWRRR
jgi:hypothetical protein